MLTLFIGGPIDGEWKDVIEDLDSYRVPVSPQVSANYDPSEPINMQFKNELYLKQRFVADGIKYDFFVHSSKPNEDIFRTLIDGYRKPVKETAVKEA